MQAESKSEFNKRTFGGVVSLAAHEHPYGISTTCATSTDYRAAADSGVCDAPVATSPGGLVVGVGGFGVFVAGHGIADIQPNAADVRVSGMQRRDLSFF